MEQSSREKRTTNFSRSTVGLLLLLLTKLNRKERFSIVGLELPRMQELIVPNHACSQGFTTLRSHTWLLLTTVSNLHRMLVVHLRCGILQQGAAFAGRGMKQGSRPQWEKVAGCSTYLWLGSVSCLPWVSTAALAVLSGASARHVIVVELL